MTFTRSCVAPVVSSVSPASGCENTVITGNYLGGATSVTIGGVSQNFVFDSDEQLTVVRPTSSGAVVVTNPVGSATSANSYTFVSCPPGISSFTPGSGCGNGVFVSGTNFKGVISVTVGGVAVDYSITSSTQIFIPRIVNSGRIVVTTASGVATSANTFNFVPKAGMNFDNPIVIGQLPCASAPYTAAINTSDVCYYDNVNNSINVGNANSGAPDVWYRFTLPATARVKITFCGSGSLEADPQIAIDDGRPYAIFNTAKCSSQGSGVLQTVLNAGTYYIVVQGAGGATGTIFFSAGIDLVPAISASPGSATVCRGQNLTLNAGAYRGTTFAWSGGIQNGVAFAPLSSGTYTVTATDGNSCTATASIPVTVNPLPTVTASPTTQTICEGATATLSGGGTVSYAWSGGVQNGVAFTPAASGSYTVTGTDARGCQNTATASVTVNPAPAVMLSPAQQSFCAGSNSTATLTVSGNAANYTWSDGINNNTPFALPNATKTYSVTATSALGCTKVATAQVIINPLPTITASPANSFACVPNQSITFNGSGGLSYTWTGGVTNGVPYTVTNPPGNYVFTVTGTDANGCQNTAAANLTVFPVSNSGSTTMYVDASKAVSGDGESWATAFKTLDEALSLVSCRPVTRINVAAGTYTPVRPPYDVVTGVPITTGDDRDKTFHVRDGIALYGGYPAGGGTRDVAANPTILSGDIGTIGNRGDNAYHVVLAVAPASGGTGVTIDGFTISEGGSGPFFSPLMVNGSNIYRSFGGGIHVVNGNNTFVNNTIINNVANEYGGGMYTTGASNTLTNNKIQNNVCEGSCGGAYFNLGTHTLSDNIINNNAGLFGFGGGLFFYAANTTLNNNTINNNLSEFAGAAVGFYQGTGVLNNNAIHSNTAPAGAGIYTEEASTTLTNNVFCDNTSLSCCGAAYISAGSHALTNNTFYNNSSTQGSGGAAGLFAETITLKNNIFWDNKYNGASNVVGADFLASGIITFTTNNNLFQLTPNLYSGFSSNALGTGSGNVFATNPSFVDIADKDGADNISRTADDGLRLACGSPAVNAGTNTDAPTLDILGNSIFATTKDMGAYEQQASEGCVLPVELLNFTGKHTATGNLLAWQTATEKDNARFVIERSADGLTFDNIGSVKGVGNSQTLKNYTFTDSKPLAGISYYRLRQEDFDGQTNYSNIIALEKNLFEDSEHSIYPAVTSDRLTFENIALFDIINVSGQIVVSHHTVVNTSVSLAHLPNGVYFVRGMDTKGRTFMEKIIKERR